ncbi:RhoGEF for Cdc42 (Gef1) [Schizosaccharomyces pombe]|uniref:Rho guanine nucleotide exchange factor gef1 n=1 Tax=Schizosaccharomyces pombe (strain 972 / ATCC 24843) TaxID=284812 RepID=GEF1_SCHPO|nr:RhoGEF Gef1 [Schizosaccharomyces pombe]Q09763.1 RecName: Full=Rho guanine nucleotide exchange factor gef1 [Schizosaccharomyces pombe 972h-]CAA90853.1 RhoGEF Gef1 [Schizosaccharomyces pombe]|eukprot:NP_592943.1 RhoGEF Gef1 [Schizosaccharomyces pombe]
METLKADLSDMSDSPEYFETLANRDLPRLPGTSKLHRAACIKRKSINLSLPSNSYSLSYRQSDDTDGDVSESQSEYRLSSGRRSRASFARALQDPQTPNTPPVSSQHRRFFSEGSFNLPNSNMSHSLNGDSTASNSSTLTPNRIYGDRNRQDYAQSSRYTLPSLPSSPSYNCPTTLRKIHTNTSSNGTSRRVSGLGSFMAQNSSETSSNRTSAYLPGSSTDEQEKRSSVTLASMPSSHSSTASLLSPLDTTSFSTKLDSTILALETDESLSRTISYATTSLPSTPGKRLSKESLAMSEASSINPEYKRIKKRANLIKELVTTEAAYLNDLIAIQQSYGLRVKECSALNPVDAQTVFGDIESLLTFTVEFHSRLYQAGEGSWRVNLDTQLIDPLPCNLGLIFLESLSEIGQIYTGYCNRQDSVFKIITKWREKPATASWIMEGDKIVQKYTNAWDLGSLIIKPLQRLLKYPLLLQKIIDVTPESSSERPDLVLSYQLLQELISGINQKQKPSHKRGSLSASHKRDAAWSLLYKATSNKSRPTTTSTELKTDARLNFQRQVLQDFRQRFAILKALHATLETWYVTVHRGFSVFEKVLAELEGLSALEPEDKPVDTWRKYHLLAHMMTANLPSQIQTSLNSSILNPITNILRVIQKVIQFIISAEFVIPAQKLEAISTLVEKEFHSVVYHFIGIQRSLYENYAQGFLFLIPQDMRDSILEETQDYAELVRAFEPMHYDDEVLLEELMKSVSLAARV